MDEKFLEIIRAEITEIVRNEIKKYMRENKYEKTYQGVVKSESAASNATDVQVKIPALGEQVFSLKNKTGEQLAKNDCVIVYAIGGNINNSYIGVKY